jgi:hypothetical protein
LLDGDTTSVVVGQQLARLVANFDFDGLQALATSLAVESHTSASQEG